jgi:hypothetical protein
MNLLFVGVILVFAKRSARSGQMDDSAASPSQFLDWTNRESRP